MQSPNRNVIVNEDDNRKLEIYTQGDLDASPTGIAVFASDAGGTLRILKQDNAGNLNVNIQSGVIYFPAGSGSNGTVTLTNASTAYSIPANASTKNHILVLYNGSDTDMYWGYATLTTGGILLASGATAMMDLGANQTVFAYCASAGKVLNYSYKEIST